MNPSSSHVCIVLVIPADQESRVVDWLMEQAGEPIEFAVHAVAARGPLVRLQAIEEQVQGFAARVEVKLVLARARSEGLIAELRELLRGVDGGLWCHPVELLEAFA